MNKIEDRINKYISERADDIDMTNKKISKKEAQEYKKFIENTIEASLEEAKDRLDDAYSGKDLPIEEFVSPLDNIRLAIEQKFGKIID